MSILRDIQTAVMSEGTSLGTALLRLRFLASRLGSIPLEDWVKHEAEGYPKQVEVPQYRVIGVSYTGTFSGPFNASIKNAPIPSHLIEKLAGEQWVNHRVRESIAGVQDMANSEGSQAGINASNLILLLQDNVYEGYACNSVTGRLSQLAFKEIVQSVRSRVLEFTIELEKEIPASVDVTIQNTVESVQNSASTVTQIFNQTIHGGITHVTATDSAQVSLAIIAGDVNSLTRELVKAGVPAEAATEVSEIVASEQPQSTDEPLGSRARAWLSKNVPKAASGAWKVGSTALTPILTKAALKYYGLE